MAGEAPTGLLGVPPSARAELVKAAAAARGGSGKVTERTDLTQDAAFQIA